MTKKLIHGGDIYSLQEEMNIEAEAILDFSANVNPLGLPKGVAKSMIECLPKVSAYPDPLCRELVCALGEYEDVNKAHIICGNGAADLIFRLVYALKPKKALVLAPTFSEYEEALLAVDCKVCYYDLLETNEFKVSEDLMTQITDELDMVFICNPNNPTGEVIPKSFLKTILQHCNEKKVMLIVDECFNDFLDMPDEYSLKDTLCDADNLFILKAFTKLYAMAGVRLGYGMTRNIALLEKMGQVGQPWGVSTIAQAAGVAALKEEDYRNETKQLIEEERCYLKEQLNQLGMHVFGSHANYIFFKSPYKVDLKRALRTEGVLIRSCDNYRMLHEDFYRIAIKNHNDNKRLIQLLKQVIDLNEED